MKTKLFNYSMLVLAPACGAVSLVLFAAAGSFHVVRMRWPEVVVLLWDRLLSLAFFLQHSGMVRRPFRARMAGVIPPRYHGAIYSIASGVVLTTVVVLWQPSEARLLTFQGLPRWILQGCSVLAIVGFAWRVLALRPFDPFGLTPIKAHLRGNPVQPSTLLVRGPYRWVRHPLYFCILVLIWSSPDQCSSLVRRNPC
jgi:methanethiol S-methyltransferase